MDRASISTLMTNWTEKSYSFSCARKQPIGKSGFPYPALEISERDDHHSGRKSINVLERSGNNKLDTQ